MSDHWKRSRITKAFADASRVNSFAEAEARLDAVYVTIVVGVDQMRTPAGQAAILTAVATARKCFGRVTLVMDGDAPLIARLPIAKSIGAAARRLGARLLPQPGKKTSHTIRIGKVTGHGGWIIRCWWNRWLSGTRAYGDDPLGDSSFALAGVFAGAAAVRQIFAGVLAGKTLRPRDATISLWTPWMPAASSGSGPDRFDVPDKFWLLGLGHLGQGFVWNLCLLGVGRGLAVVQDDQAIGEENEATGLLVLPGQTGEKKVRLASRWLERCGWQTSLIERRHYGDIRLTQDDPPYLLCGLDRVEPRIVMAHHGFEFMIDAGLGHGPYDFEGIQLRIIAKGRTTNGLWNEGTKTTPGELLDKFLDTKAYADLAKRIGRCGIVSFAQASTGVPFVGAAAGALTIAQAIRLCSLETSTRFLQMELGAPEMVTYGDFVDAPKVNLGSTSITLSAGA